MSLGSPKPALLFLSTYKDTDLPRFHLALTSILHPSLPLQHAKTLEVGPCSIQLLAEYLQHSLVLVSIGWTL